MEANYMTKPNQILMWLSAALMLTVGFLITLKGSNAGWFLVFMGIIYIVIPIRRGQTTRPSNPSLEHWVSLGITTLSLLVVILMAVMAV
jgi:hypothetical protein